MDPAESASCKAVATNKGNLFLLVTWGEGAFDIVATDAKGCWQASGVTAPLGHKFGPTQWMEHAKEALFDTEPSRCFGFEVEFPVADQSTMKLFWAATYEDGLDYTCGVKLAAAADRDSVMSALLSHLCDSYAVLTVSLRHTRDSCRKLAASLEDSQAQCQATIEASNERETDLLLKFNVLLNSKKAKIAELAQQLLDAQAELQEMVVRAADGDGGHTDNSPSEASREDEEPHGTLESDRPHASTSGAAPGAVAASGTPGGRARATGPASASLAPAADGADGAPLPTGGGGGKVMDNAQESLGSDAMEHDELADLGFG